MRTINKNILLRMVAQADEADIRGQQKISTMITNQIVKYADNDLVRDEDEDDKYTYTSEDIESDIKEGLWNIAIRMSDFYDFLPDARQIESIVDGLYNEVMNSFENMIPEDKRVPRHEEPLPGEEQEDEIDDGEIDSDVEDEEEEIVDEVDELYHLSPDDSEEDESEEDESEEESEEEESEEESEESEEEESEEESEEEESEEESEESEEEESEESEEEESEEESEEEESEEESEEEDFE